MPSNNRKKGLSSPVARSMNSVKRCFASEMCGSVVRYRIEKNWGTYRVPIKIFAMSPRSVQSVQESRSPFDVCPTSAQDGAQIPALI